MKCQLIQTSKLNDSNRAEREMLDFLTNLPEEFFVYRELKITSAYEERVYGLDKRQPDFVVVGPSIGLVAIEVKDWDITKNIYQWRDQYTILKTNPAGETEEIHNPADQADTYQFALMELVTGLKIFVTSVVAFPGIAKQEFLNRVENVELLLQRQQSRFLIDLDQTIFKEDLDEGEIFRHPERLLNRLVRQNNRFYAPSAEALEQTHQRLIPNAFRIGDFSRRQAYRQKLKLITEEQKRWIFGVEYEANYLFDVAGSGKTNALVSRAIFLVDEALKHHQNPPRILLTTYNENLARNIRHIFDHKLPESKDRQRYKDAIVIESIPTWLRLIVENYYGVLLDNPTEETLRQEVEEILRNEPERYRRFDYLFIDEIQDFDDFFLIVAKHLCRSDNFFFVGDIGQKIYDRTHHLERLGLVPRRVELKKSYKMHRTPRYIAELATRFILGETRTRQEFETHGYTEQFQYPNLLANGAVMLRSRQPAQDLVHKIQSLLAGTFREEDLMVITSTQQLDAMVLALDKAGVNYTLGEKEQGGSLTLVDFMNVKGLEKEVVLVSGIEDLYHRGKAEGIFVVDEEDKVRQERFSRRKIYVAITRPLEELFIYYTDPDSRFVAELLKINRQLLDHRSQGT
ncbi:MAG: hypothetical protein DPW09_29710 [Anaerolineae bacterium]|nr:hypothetical protein [Anaerolineae bacterium]